MKQLFTREEIIKLAKEYYNRYESWAKSIFDDGEETLAFAIDDRKYAIAHFIEEMFKLEFDETIKLLQED